MDRSTASSRVLVIDDERAALTFAREKLKQCRRPSYEVESASSFAAGMACLRDRRYDACLVGHELGTHSGLDLIREVERQGLKVPIVLVIPPESVVPRASALEVDAMNAGAADCIDAERLEAGLLERSLRYVIERHRTMEALKQSEERLRHEILHDSLTGLPNRTMFLDRLERALARRSRKPDSHCAVLFIDLDRFKVVNDSLGHIVADRLLLALARRFETCLRVEDTMARFGGDEFTILLDDIRGEQDAIRVAERIHTELQRPILLEGEEVFTTASIGIALATQEISRATDLLRAADTALYRAKSQGKARYELFAPGMHFQAVQLLRLENDLRRAVEAKEFRLLFQPVVAIASGKLLGFEALVRWHHPERGLVPPSEFLPLAEETGVIVPIGRWVLEEACRRTADWHRRYECDPKPYVAVNLSAREFQQRGLIPEIQRVLDETGLPPKYLKIEITEGVLQENVFAPDEILHSLKQLGLGLFIDDFGTGYSSLASLHRYPIDTLKIDRSFVNNMTIEKRGSAIVRTILALAWNLGLDVVAEGVETAEQRLLLTALGCPNAQGYLFSKPLPVDDVEDLLGSGGTLGGESEQAA